MRKLFIIFCLMNSLCFASVKLHVESLEDFNSIQPHQTFKVKLIEDSKFYNTTLIRNDIINCELQKITDPKRAKQDAKIFYILKNYKDNLGIHNFDDVYVAKYAKTVLKENKGKLAKKTATTVGSMFVKGLSYGVSFTEGVINNEENNRLKSGAKKMYDDSFLSMVEYGEEVEIKKGDKFYLIVKKLSPDENENDNITASETPKETVNEVETENEIKVNNETEPETETEKETEAEKETKNNINE